MSVYGYKVGTGVLPIINESSPSFCLTDLIRGCQRSRYLDTIFVKTGVRYRKEKHLLRQTGVVDLAMGKCMQVLSTNVKS